MNEEFKQLKPTRYNQRQNVVYNNSQYGQIQSTKSVVYGSQGLIENIQVSDNIQGEYINGLMANQGMQGMQGIQGTQGISGMVFQQNLQGNYLQTNFQNNTSNNSQGNIQANTHVSSNQFISRSRSPNNSLQWSQREQKIVVDGNSDFSHLKNLRNLIFSMRQEWSGQAVAYGGQFSDSFGERLILLEKQIDGLLRRQIVSGVADGKGGVRNLDYASILTQKDKEVREMEIKVGKLQEQLRKRDQQVANLQNQISSLSQTITMKNKQIQLFKRQSDPRLKQEDHEDSCRNYIENLQKQLSKIKAKKNLTFNDLTLVLDAWIISLPNISTLKQKLMTGQLRIKEDAEYRRLITNLQNAAALYKLQIQRLKKQNPNLPIRQESNILELLILPNYYTGRINDIIQLTKQIKVTTEVAASNQQTLGLMAGALRKINLKYPGVLTEINPKLSALIESQAQTSLDLVTQMVIFKPQVVRVQNVYQYKRDSNLDFRLKVIIMALLDAIRKMKLAGGAAIGAQIGLDQGVIAGIHAQLGDMGAQLTDLLAIFAVQPRTQVVEKVIQKNTQVLVQIPMRYGVLTEKAVPFQTKTTQIVQNQRIVQVLAQKGIPLLQQRAVVLKDYEEKVVGVPELHERVFVDRQYQKTGIPVNVQQEKVVEVEVPVEVVRDKIVIQEIPKIIQLEKEVVRYITQIQERIVEVPVFHEKIVERVIERQKAVPVIEIHQKIVQVIRYEKAPQMIPFMETRVEIVPQIQQKIVPIIQIQQRIVQVPQKYTEIVTVQKVINPPPQIVYVTKEVPVFQTQIEQVEVQVPYLVHQTETVIKEVPVYIDKPVIQERVVIQKELQQVPAITTVQKIIHVPVNLEKHVVINQSQPFQVIKHVPYLITETKPIQIIQEKCVPVDTIIQRIKEIPTIKEKIVQVLVQVPKCVQIEKIVEKIVIVPRIVQKIVHVPQIIQKIVEKEVIVERIKQVEVRVEVPCIKEIPREIPVERIVYVEKQYPVEYTNQILKVDKQIIHEAHYTEITKQRVVIERHQVPKELLVQKIVPIEVEKHFLHEVEKPVLKPIQVPFPIYFKEEVPITVNTETVKIMPVDRQIQKIVQIEHQKVKIVNLTQIQEKVVIERKEVPRQVEVPYFNEVIKQIKTIQEKTVPIYETIQKFLEVQTITEKLVTLIHEVPKVYQYTNQPEHVILPPKIEIVQEVIPKIININKYIEVMVEKLWQVDQVIRENQVHAEAHEKVVQGRNTTQNIAREIELSVEKQLLRERTKQVTQVVNHIDQAFQIIEKVVNHQKDVLITHDRIIDVPVVLQKILQKIALMPQVLEVCKYIYQIAENQKPDIAVNIEAEANLYVELGLELEKGLGQLLAELARVKSLQQSSAPKIALIEQYFKKFRRFIKYPKIHEIIKKEVVQKSKIVTLPTKTPEAQREQLSRLLLIQQLINELTRVANQHPDVHLQLGEEIVGLFALDLTGKVSRVQGQFQRKLKDFQKSIDKKLNLPNWESQKMLKPFIEERFLLASKLKQTNQQILKGKQQNQQLVISLNNSHALIGQFQNTLASNISSMQHLHSLLNNSNPQLAHSYASLIEECQSLMKTIALWRQEGHLGNQAVGVYLPEVQSIVQSAVSQKNKEIHLLKEIIRKIQTHEGHDECQTILKLQKQIGQLWMQGGGAGVIKGDGLGNSSGSGNSSSNQLQISRLTSQIDQLRKQNESLRQKPNQLAITITNLQLEINRLNILVKNSGNHDSCNAQIARLKRELQNARRQIQSYRRQVQTLKRELQNQRLKLQYFQKHGRESVNTNITSPNRPNKSESSEQYGSNYQQFVQGNIRGLGTTYSNVQNYEYDTMRKSEVRYGDLAKSNVSSYSSKIGDGSNYISSANILSANNIGAETRTRPTYQRYTNQNQLQDRQ